MGRLQRRSLIGWIAMVLTAGCGDVPNEGTTNDVVPAISDRTPGAPSKSPAVTHTVQKEPLRAYPINAPDTAVWLSDLPGEDIKVGRGEFGTQGNLGIDGLKIMHNGEHSPHGLGMSPGTDHKATVTYQLDGKYRTFRAVAALDDTVFCSTPMYFVVYCDRWRVWESWAMRSAGEKQECVIDVTGVKKLELVVLFHADYDRDKRYAHAVWLEPYVDASPPTDPAGPVPVRTAKTFIDSGEKIESIQKEARRWLKEEKFQAIDNRARELRADYTPLRGYRQINYFHDALAAPAELTEPAIKEHLQQIERWVAAEPDSYCAQLAKGQFNSEHAWRARGTGWATTVTEDGWKKFGQYLKIAREILEPLRKHEDRDAHLYAILMHVARGQSWTFNEKLVLFNEARDDDPRDTRILITFAESQTIRWGGEPGQIEAIADSAKETLEGVKGEMAWAQVLTILLWEYKDEFFDHVDVAYEELKPALVALMAANPDWEFIADDVAYVAVLANDIPFAREMFHQFGASEIDCDVWESSDCCINLRRRAFDTRQPENLVHTLDEATEMITSLEFTPDGKLLIGGGEEKFLIWDVQTGELVADLRMPAHVMEVDVSPASSLIAAILLEPSTQMHGLVLVDLSQGEPRMGQLLGQSSAIRHVDFSDDGQHLAVSVRSGAVHVWPVDALDRPVTIKLPDGGYSTAFSPDGKTLAVTSDHGGLWFYDPATGEMQGEPLVQPRKSSWYCQLHFTSDSKRLASVSLDGKMRVWDLATREHSYLRENEDSIRWVELTSDDKLMAIGRRSGKVQLYETDTLKRVHEFAAHLDAVNCLKFSPDEKLLASGSSDALIRLWDVKPWVKQELDE